MNATGLNPSPISNHARPGEYRVPDRAHPTECSTCHAPILWTRTSKNGRPIPLSAATIRTDECGRRWALNHFADCPNAAQHRRQTAPAQFAIVLNLRDLPDYLERQGLVIVSSTVTDGGNGRLLVELQTRKA